MTSKKKAASLSKAGTPDETASTTDFKLNNNRTFRQLIKQIIVMVAAHELMPSTWAVHLISKGGLIHD